MSDEGVADDKLASFIDRILRMKAEEDAIKSDIREIYAEAKGRGYDKTRLGETVSTVRKLEKDADGEAEKEAIRDLYLTAYFRAKNKPHAHAYAKGAVLTRTEPQSAPQAATGDDVAAEPIASQPIQQETAAMPHSTEPALEQVLSGARTELIDLSSGHRDIGVRGAGGAAILDAGSSNGRTAEFDSANAGSTPAPASKPMYAAPGVVATEHTPPEPVRRHPISTAFAELGQDPKLHQEVFGSFGGVKQPIVKIGCEILDGWARYNAARSMHMDYPVVQYVGTDIMADAINWNLASRKLTQGQISTVIARLVNLYPDREQEILGMFDTAYGEAA